LCLISSGLFGQPLILVSGSKEKKVTPGQWIEVSAATYNNVIRDQCYCPQWTGKLVMFTGDSIRLQLLRTSSGESTHDNTRFFRQDHYRDQFTPLPVISLAVKDLTLITVKGKGKKVRENTALGSAGLILTVFGTGTLAAAPFAENSGEVALIGASELVVGIVLGVTGQYRKYYLTPDLPETHRKRIWQIKLPAKQM
jgi:hypothetical protein